MWLLPNENFIIVTPFSKEAIEKMVSDLISLRYNFPWPIKRPFTGNLKGNRFVIKSTSLNFRNNTPEISGLIKSKGNESMIHVNISPTVYQVLNYLCIIVIIFFMFIVSGGGLNNFSNLFGILIPLIVVYAIYLAFWKIQAMYLKKEVIKMFRGRIIKT